MEASGFVGELIAQPEVYPICQDEVDDVLKCAEFPMVACPTCGTGSLVPRTGTSGSFIGCDHYPYCRHTESACPKCGGIMRSSGRARRCATPGCDATVPVCPECGGDMLVRTGPYGKFWGCQNYRRNSDSPCMHKEKIETLRAVV